MIYSTPNYINNIKTWNLRITCQIWLNNKFEDVDDSVLASSSSGDGDTSDDPDPNKSLEDDDATAPELLFLLLLVE